MPFCIMKTQCDEKWSEIESRASELKEGARMTLEATLSQAVCVRVCKGGEFGAVAT